MGASSSGRYPRSNNLRVASDPIVPLKTDPGRPCANIRLLACANGEILDVCTITGRNLAGKPQPDVGRRRGGRPLTDRQRRKLCFRASHAFERYQRNDHLVRKSPAHRSAERRTETAWVSTCRSRWVPYH